jgi:hypothetical protein
LKRCCNKGNKDTAYSLYALSLQSQASFTAAIVYSCTASLRFIVYIASAYYASTAYYIQFHVYCFSKDKVSQLSLLHRFIVNSFTAIFD